MTHKFVKKIHGYARTIEGKENMNIALPFPLLMGISSLISVLVVVLFLLWFFKIRKVLNIRILREYGDAFKMIVAKKLPYNTETFNYGKHSYFADTTVSIFDKNNNPTLYYLQGHAKPIHIVKPANIVDSRILKTTLESNEYDNMMKNPRDKLNMTFFIVLVCIICGLAGVWMFRETQHNAYVIELIKNQTMIPPPTFGGS